MQKYQTTFYSAIYHFLKHKLRGKTGGDTSIQGMHRKIRSLVHVPQSYHIEINAMVQYWSLDSACHLRGIKLSSRGV
ncbi:hypothetical protein Bca4012_074600 [Brassica carinata]